MGLPIRESSESADISHHRGSNHKRPADWSNDSIATINEPRAITIAAIAKPVVIFHLLCSGSGNLRSGFSRSRSLPFAVGRAPYPFFVNDNCTRPRL